MKIFHTTLIFVFISVNVLAQNTSNNFFKKKKIVSSRSFEIPTSKAEYFSLDVASLSTKMSAVKGRGRQAAAIVLPLPDGTFEEFEVKESIVMSAKLAAKFPGIKTYVGVNRENGYSTVRFEVSPSGFHAMLSTPKGTVYIDPINRKNSNEYQSYYEKDFLRGHKDDFQEGKPIDDHPALARQVNELVERGGAQRPSGTELRTYRLAVTATGEYTRFHGGTVEGALSAIVTTMNRINGIYEKEVSIRMVLVDNTDQLIFTDRNTDPYTRENLSELKNEVQAKIDEIIGDANYDIGHGFSTVNGGLANLNVSCKSGLKASGVSGRLLPIGDPYDVYIVAHEFGHQFGASHTFNGTTGSCSAQNRTGYSAYEPGSGTTIMSYGGTCIFQNIQYSRDDYFHTQSADEIIAYTTLSGGNSCPVVTFTGNNAPIVEVGEGGFTIPRSTPFKLNGSATDLDGDKLVYSWEQFDLGPAGPPQFPTGNAPLFRSFPPVDESYRIFPQISDIVNNTRTIGEVLPNYSRSLKFRLTARDNREGGGGVDYNEISFDVTDQAGPFIVTEPNVSMSLTVLTPQTIRWTVANTNINPVNCQKVNILLSTDGGLTFPTTLVSNTDNDGEVTVLIPDVTTSQARVKVEAADNIFFDISNVDFNIAAPTTDDFIVFVDNETPVVCTANGVINIQVGKLGEFTTPVTLTVAGLPDSYNATFDTNPVVPGNIVPLTISNTISETGIYDVEITGEAAGITHTQNISLTVPGGIPEIVMLQTPMDGNTDVSLLPTLNWDAVSGADSYTLQIALDVEFVNVVSEVTVFNESTYILEDKLGSNTNYYWRVRASNSCGDGSYSAINSFSTIQISCFEGIYSGDPIAISARGTSKISSIIEVTEDGIVSDINVKNIVGKHEYVSDLLVVLKSPAGTSVTLFTEICDDSRDFDLGFDDQATTSSISCPPIGKGIYVPEQALSAFEGESSMGTWTLEISDVYFIDGGQLEGWTLEICVNGAITNIANAPTDLSTTTVSSNQINMTWNDNAADEIGHVVERSLGNNFNFLEVVQLPRDATSYSDRSLEGGLTYFYRIKAIKNDAGNSFSNESFATTIISVPNAPSDLTTESKSIEHVKIGWEDNSNTETEYVVEKSTNNANSYVVVANYPANIVSHIDVNVSVGTTYYYRVKAVNTQGDSEYSNEVEVITPINPFPAQPTNFTATVNSSTEIILTWNDIAINETSYRIDRSLNSYGYEELVVLDADTETYMDTELTPKTKYYYRIAAVNQAGSSQATLVAATTANAPPIAPGELTAMYVEDHIFLQWEHNATNTNEFVIEKSTGENTNFVELSRESIDNFSSTESFSHVDRDVEAETTYYYRVKAVNTQGDSEYSNEVEVITPINPFPAQPTNFTATVNSSTEIILIWNDIAINETSYRIDRSLNGYNYGELVVLDADTESYIDIGLTPKTKYYYRITAVNEAGSSQATLAAATTANAPPIAPSELTAMYVVDRIFLQWKHNATNADEFVIEKSIGGNTNFVELSRESVDNFSPTESFSHVDRDVEAGITYTYRIFALNTTGNSDYSNEVEVITPINPFPAQPTNFTATVNSPTEIILTWNDIAINETSYRIDRSLNGYSYGKLVVLDADTESYIDRGLTPKTKYYYRITAVNEAGSSQATLATATTANAPPIAPGELTAMYVVDHIFLQWEHNATNTDEFVIEKSTGGNTNFVELSREPIDNFSYVDRDVEAGITYTYRIFALNITGNSDYSNEVIITIDVLGLADDILKQGVKIYPNPSEDEFVLKIDNATSGIHTILLSNIVGREINKVFVEKQGKVLEQTFDLSDQPKGVYLIQISNGQGISTHRVLKY